MRKLFSLIFFITTIFHVTAHPHVFIDIGVEVQDVQTATISWTFDLIESENKIYFFDDNGDKILDEKESENLFNEGFSDIKDFNYFITVNSKGNQYPVNEISNFKAVVNEENLLQVTFNINLPHFEDKISITHFDTSYFIAFSEPNINSIKLSNNLYSAILKNREKPFYYDPQAGRNVKIDTSQNKAGWLKAYPTEIFISTTPIIDSFGDYKISYKEKFIQIQRTVYLKLSQNLSSMKDNKNLKITIYIMFLAFIYGCVHAIGPGHRKVIISTYILSTDKISYFKAVLISLLSAGIHSGSGIIIILILRAIFSLVKPIFITNINNSIETISYIGVLILSVALIIFKILSTKNRQSDSKGNKSIGLSLIITSSLIPCPGAITIMLFASQLQMVHIGVLTVFAMSLGIGLTLSIISIISLKSKNIISNRKCKYKNISSFIEWMGLIIIFFFSVLMIFSFN